MSLRALERVISTLFDEHAVLKDKNLVGMDCSIGMV